MRLARCGRPLSSDVGRHRDLEIASKRHIRCHHSYATHDCNLLVVVRFVFSNGRLRSSSFDRPFCDGECGICYAGVWRSAFSHPAKVSSSQFLDLSGCCDLSLAYSGCACHATSSAIQNVHFPFNCRSPRILVLRPKSTKACARRPTNRSTGYMTRPLSSLHRMYAGELKR